MRRSQKRLAATALRIAGVVLVGFGCASCVDEYLARRDSLAAGAGDAVQANIAVQTIDPSPPHANRTAMSTNGELVQHAMEQYRNPTRTTAAPLTPSTPANGTGVPTVR